MQQSSHWSMPQASSRNTAFCHNISERAAHSSFTRMFSGELPILFCAVLQICMYSVFRYSGMQVCMSVCAYVCMCVSGHVGMCVREYVSLCVNVSMYVVSVCMVGKVGVGR